jgi:hypothetical protein
MCFLKFLRATEFNIDNAKARLNNTLQWRYENEIDKLANGMLPGPFQGHDMMQGADKNGRPILVRYKGGTDKNGRPILVPLFLVTPVILSLSRDLFFSRLVLLLDNG